jgi:hypothetical protein
VAIQSEQTWFSVAAAVVKACSRCCASGSGSNELISANGPTADSRMTGPAGELLARINMPACRPRAIAEHAFPSAAFDPLLARGVPGHRGEHQVLPGVPAPAPG